MRKLMTKIMSWLKKMQLVHDLDSESGIKFDPVIDPDTLDPITGPLDPITGPLDPDKLDPGTVPIPEFDWRTKQYRTQKEVENEKETEPGPVLDLDPIDPILIEAEIRKQPTTVNRIKHILTSSGYPGYEIFEDGKNGVNTRVYAMVGGIRVPENDGFFLCFIARPVVDKNLPGINNS